MMEFESIHKICMMLSSLFEIYLVMNFYQAFHRFRKSVDRNYKKYLFLILFVCINIGINFQNNSSLNLFLIPIIYLVMLVTMFKGNVKSYLVHWVLASVVIFGSEFVFLMLQGIPMNVPTDKLFKEPFVMLSSIFAVKLVSFILFLVCKQISKISVEKFSAKLFGSYIIVPIATLGIMWAIPYVREINETITKGDMVLVAFYIIMLIGNIRLFYMFVQYGNIKNREKQKEITLAKYVEKERHFKEMEKSEKRYNVLLHNMKHYLRQIRIYAEEDSNAEIIETVEDLQGEYLENERDIICAHSLLNSILLDWRARSNSQRVQTDIFVEQGFNISYMRGIDIMAVFGNLLDNALEAAKQCEVGKIRIKMFMQNDGAFSIIHIRNNYAGELKQVGEKLVSTKEDDGKAHGIGIESVREIVEKYHGVLENIYSNQQYQTTIMIPVVEKEE